MATAAERAKAELDDLRRGLQASKRLDASLRRPPPERRGGGRAGLASRDAALRLVVSRCLAGGLELYGVYGPSVAARDLASLARACRAFVPIARDGFQELAADVARQEDAAGEATTQLLLHAQQHVEDLRQFAEQQRELPDNEEDWWEQDKRTLEPPEHDGALHLPAGLEWGFWDALLADPAGLKAADLKRGAAALGLETSGTKAQLQKRILDDLDAWLHMAPARLLRAMRLERAVNLMHPGACSGALEGLRTLLDRRHAAGGALLGAELPELPYVSQPHEVEGLSLRDVRHSLAWGGVRSMHDLLARIEAAERRADPERLRSCRAAAKKERDEWVARHELRKRTGICKCGAPLYNRGAVRCPNCEEGRRDMKEYYRMKRLHHNYYARLYYGGSGYY